MAEVVIDATMFGALPVEVTAVMEKDVDEIGNTVVPALMVGRSV